jgi:hypothetical protein
MTEKAHLDADQARKGDPEGIHYIIHERKKGNFLTL